ncbi:MAG: hypothetical protein RLZZ387_1532 [Chloroflexota bacterium]|jgi:hypothetical protein
MPLAWLIISQLLAAASLLPWFPMALMSFMSTDSGVTPGAIAFIVVMWSYPLLPIICSIVAWVLFARGNVSGAMWATSIPLLFVLVLLAAYLVFSMT